MDVLSGSRGPNCFERGLDHRAKIDRPDVESELAADDSRNVEQVVDDLSKHPCVALNRLQRAPGYVVVERSGSHQLSPAQDRIQRCPQLVRNGSEKLVLYPVCLSQIMSPRFHGAFEFRGVTFERRLLGLQLSAQLTILDCS